MPWNSKDAKKHTKRANSGKKQRQWEHIANAELEGGADEGTAIKIANGVLKRQAHKSLNAFEELEIIAKSFADSVVPQSVHTVRTFKRKFDSKKTGTRVKPFRRRKFTAPELGNTGEVENE